MEKEIIYFCRHFWIVFCGIAPIWAAGIVGGSVVSVFAKERLNALFARHIARALLDIRGERDRCRIAALHVRHCAARSLVLGKKAWTRRRASPPS